MKGETSTIMDNNTNANMLEITEQRAQIIDHTIRLLDVGFDDNNIEEAMKLYAKEKNTNEVECLEIVKLVIFKYRN